MGERNEYLLLVVGGWAGVSQTGFCMNAAFSLVSPQPTLFIIASTLAFYGANPFCFLVTVLQFMHMIYPPVCSVKCLHVSVIHVSLLCHLCFPSSPSLPFLLIPHLSGKMNRNRSEHLLWTNKCSVCSSRWPLSMATHEGELQDMFQADQSNIGSINLNNVYLKLSRLSHLPLSSGMCYLPLSFFPFWLWPYGRREFLGGLPICQPSGAVRCRGSRDRILTLPPPHWCLLGSYFPFLVFAFIIYKILGVKIDDLWGLF